MAVQFSSPLDPSERRGALALMAHASCEELEAPLRKFWPDLATRDLRPAEGGLVMLRGRIGGDGALFNLGEATVSRAVVTVESGEIGYGHVLGRDPERARLIAIVDALWQRAEDRPTVEVEILAPLKMRIESDQARTRAETAATKVDFFTLVRGDN